MIIKSYYNILLLLFFLGSGVLCENRLFYVCTSADSDFFNYLINMVNSVHRFNFDQLGEISVFDLGFTKEQKEELNKIEKLKVYNIEMVHPDLLTHFRADNDGRHVRGWFAWKPVAMKKMLDMFPYMIYMDAGLMLLRPMDELFKEVWEKDYLVTGAGHNIEWMTPRHVIEFFDLESDEYKWILNEEGIAGGFMGLTRAMYNDFILPMYNFAHDINHFVDDGTTPNGFGTGRHDQVLFSIQGRLLGLEVPSWNNQARVVLSHGYRMPCLYKDIVIRTRNVWNVNRDSKRIRKFIHYKPQKKYKSDQFLKNIQIYDQDKKLLIQQAKCGSFDIDGEGMVIKKFIKDGDIIFDVGANVGKWSSFVLKFCKPKLLFAFEPIPEPYKTCCSVLEKTGARVFNYAVFSNDNKNIQFYSYINHYNGVLSSLYQRNLAEQKLNITPEILSIKTRSLDSFCKEQNIDHIDFLKIDTEGAEFDVLSGASRLLQDNIIDSIQFEYGLTYKDSNKTLKQVVKLLSDNSYSIFKIYSNFIVHVSKWEDYLERYDQCNYLALLLPEGSKYGSVLF